MSTPTRFPKGVTNVNKENPLGNYGLPDPTQWHTYFNDFDNYVAGDWTITNVGTTPAQALADVDGGALLLTMADTDDSSSQLQLKGEGFKLKAGKKTIFKTRFAVSDATQSDWVAGLLITDTTIIGVLAGDGATDGIFFQKDDGDTNIDFYVQKDATTGQLTSTAVTTASAAGVFMELAWYFDGVRYVNVFKDGAQVYTADLTTTLTTYLPDTELTVTFGVQNGEAVIKTLTMDYIFVSQER